MFIQTRMRRSQKIKMSLAAIGILIVVLYMIVDPEGLETVGACLFFGFMLLVGWANSNSPADRSRDTIDWEMEQERREQEREDEMIRNGHHK